MKKISVIIVNYNTKDILKQCLTNLLNIMSSLQIIVVDNGSNDGSYNMLKKDFPNVVAIKSKNQGIAKGYNKALKKAQGDYYLFLGTDAFPTKKSLVGIVTYMENHSNVGVCTAKLVLRDGTLDMDAHRGFPTPLAAITHFSRLNRLFPHSKFFNKYFLGYKNMAKPHQIDLCISHFMFVKNKVFNDVKMWDEDFFVFGEDVDFCYRVKQNGWKIMYLPQFEVLHLKGVSVGIRKSSGDITTASKKTKSNMRKHTTLAMELFYKKHYQNKYPKIITLLILFGIKVLSWLRV
ncbi:glycosyl transferase family 2 [candidate division WWE3 bacterium CG10_big_fil_rev_8_21_14_0_10_32_10]|uniref:Glycosyl transferase family 2 n=1 Tax=candidate division WWE3 bacterium CG10_big_fil_rev_8_21_14_0_10_32_10 TaxID=1975090 RepID=A0A2H0RAE0_UNCKA|nr:MAG: glycosyl transferase family 2 [candidate division WWE3 bacterium CG10_big_fil_rev_8_21_14_0_10_32_10]